MKLRSLLVMAALALGVTSAANAGTFWIGPEAALSLPTGDFSDAANTGWDGGVTGTYMMDPMWGIGADIGYHSWTGTDELNEAIDFLLGTTGAEATFSAIQYTPHLVWMAPTEGSLKPWAKLGVGGYNVGTKVEAPGLGEESESETEVGFNIGGGLMFQSSPNMGIGIGAAYHMIATKDEDTGAENTNIITFSGKLLWAFGGTP